MGTDESLKWLLGRRVAYRSGPGTPTQIGTLTEGSSQRSLRILFQDPIPAVEVVDAEKLLWPDRAWEDWADRFGYRPYRLGVQSWPSVIAVVDKSDMSVLRQVSRAIDKTTDYQFEAVVVELDPGQTIRDSQSVTLERHGDVIERPINTYAAIRTSAAGPRGEIHEVVLSRGGNTESRYGLALTQADNDLLEGEFAAVLLSQAVEEMIGWWGPESASHGTALASTLDVARQVPNTNPDPRTPSVAGWIDTKVKPVEAIVENSGPTPIRSVTLTPTVRHLDVSDGSVIAQFGGTPLTKSDSAQIGPGEVGRWTLDHFGDLRDSQSAQTFLSYEFQDAQGREWVGRDGTPPTSVAKKVLAELVTRKRNSGDDIFSVNDELNDLLGSITRARQDRVRAELINEAWVTADFEPLDGPPYVSFMARELTDRANAAVAESDTSLTPIVAGYTIIDGPMRGGQAEVWKAIRNEDGLQVAIKFLRIDPLSETPAEDLRRFQREVKYQGGLKSPGIAEILESQINGDVLYYVMPWADTSLEALLSKSGPLPLSEAVKIVCAVLEALTTAHKAELLHRDLKPGNILLFGETWCLADFGLSRYLSSTSTTITQANTGFGTMAYMPPEQFEDLHTVDVTADLYSVGKLFYELLTGKLPFPVMNLDLVHERYRHIVERCTRIERAERYSSAELVLKRIHEAADPALGSEAPFDRAEAIIATLNSGVSSLGVEELHDLLTQNASDFDLVTAVMIQMNAEAVRACFSSDAEGFDKALTHFDRHVDQSLPFGFTDKVADFLARVFDSIGSTEASRRVVLHRLFKLGFAHGRWHVGSTFARLLMSRSDDVHCFMSAEIISEDPECANWNATYVQQGKLPTAIRSAFPKGAFE